MTLVSYGHLGEIVQHFQCHIHLDQQVMSLQTLSDPLQLKGEIPNPSFPKIVYVSQFCYYETVSNAYVKMAASKPGLRKPVFTKVEQLRPGTGGHTLTVKVVSAKMVLQKGRADGPQVRQMKIAECLVGDETGLIIFTARNDQVDLMQEGTTVILRNAKIDMFKGSMRLAVDRWGRVEVTEPADFTVKEDNNLSLIEYELVNVVEE
ncbi:hypothetical protein H0E87_018458 [Populus deltoides]|uniref:Single-stranded DNA binding protein Ssb-like OB fold domain-containing protein n=1 Tax=Populus deltoides TaxID=3696 RepID=A0A8T2XQB4_POPDE|nr:hypothetical protein H0E87_018458 [Populus deltoides]